MLCFHDVGKMRRLVLPSLAAAGIAVAGAPSAGAAVASPPALSLDFRTWTFRELGFPADTFRPVRGFDRPSFEYRLPATVKQGGNGWWLITLHLRIRTRSVPPGHSAIVGAATNQVGCAYIRLTAVRTARGPAVRWTTVGIVDGTSTGIVHGRSFDLWFSNYLAIPGVRPGENVLGWMVDDNGLVSSVTVLPSSSLTHSRLSPARIAVHELVDQRVRLGKPMRVIAVVRNLGGMDARNIVVSVDPAHGGFVPVSRPVRSLSRLRHGRVARISFTLTPLARGPQQIGLSATSNSNQTAALSTVTVVASTGTGWGWWVGFGMWLAVAILAIAIAARRATTRRRVLTAAAAAAAPVALLWALIQADPLAVAAIAATTGSIAAWLRRWRSGGSDWVAAPVLAVFGLALNLAMLLVAARNGK